MADNYHLTYNREKEGWDIKKAGGSRPSDHFASHSKALKRARELTVNANGNLIIHDESGAIVGSESTDDINKGVLTRAAETVSDKVEGAIGAVTGAFRS